MDELPSYLFASYGAGLTVLLGFAAWRDVATRTIPDGVSIALLALGAALRLCSGWGAFVVSLGIAILLFLCLLPLCSRGLLGGADLKLITALSAGLPPQSSLQLLLAVTVAGGILAGLYVLAGKVLGRTGAASSLQSRASILPRRILAIEFWRIRRGAPLPYGIAIAAGAAFVVLQQTGV